MSKNQSKTSNVLSKSAKSDDKKLTPKQYLFCKLYATDREFFGNGTQAYIEAYNINLAKKGAYQTAMANASRLLSNAKILDRIDELLEITLNDQHVDKQLAFWLTQKASPQAAVAAIKEYNQLKKRTESHKNINLIAVLLERYGIDAGQTPTIESGSSKDTV